MLTDRQTEMNKEVEDTLMRYDIKEIISDSLDQFQVSIVQRGLVHDNNSTRRNYILRIILKFISKYYLLNKYFL